MAETQLTVLIPTRDRCATLGKTIETCLMQDYANLSVVVCDNESVDATADVVASFSDPRLRYVRTGRRLSMTGNFEFSLRQVDTGFVMHLGDDDGLVGGALPRVDEIIRRSGLRAVTSSLATYRWPNALDEAARNKMVFSTYPGFERRTTSAVIRDVIAFKRHYPELPGTYSGFVDISVVRAAMSDGRYYHSITPDSYSGFANASQIAEYAYVWTPFAIAGISGRSNGGAQVASVIADEAVRYERENDLPFSSELTYCPRSVEIIVAEAFLQAQNRLPSLAAHRLDYGRLCAVALRESPPVHYPAVRNAVLKIAELHGVALPRAVRRDRDAATKSRVERYAAKASKLRRGLSRLRRGYRNLDAADFQVTDVAGAARLLQVVSIYEGSYVGTLRNLRRWVARF